LYLQQAKWAINTTSQETTKRTPFELVFARRPNQPFDLTLPRVDSTPLTKQLTKIRKIRKNIRAVIAKSQAKSKTRHDKGRSQPTYKIGDQILVYTPATKTGQNAKLTCRWQEPYKIINVLSDLNYVEEKNKKTEK